MTALFIYGEYKLEWSITQMQMHCAHMALWCMAERCWQRARRWTEAWKELERLYGETYRYEARR